MHDSSRSPEMLTDEEVVQRVLAGELAIFEVIMRRYNQRIFRVVRSLLTDDDEAEDVVQDAYVKAFEHLQQFQARASFATWLTRIALHEAIARQRRRQRVQVVDLNDPGNSSMVPHASTHAAEQQASNKELGSILTAAVDQLPDDLRTVFALRMVEGLDTSETADCLDLTTANVKVRLHRARALLQKQIDQRLGPQIRQLYQFGGARCDRTVAVVLARLSPRQAQGDAE